MALKAYQVVIGDKVAEIRASSPRVAINRCMYYGKLFTEYQEGRRISLKDRDIPLGKSLIITVNRLK